jgi:uncharacterized protein YycO
MSPQPADFFLLIGTDPVGVGIRIGEWADGKGFSKYAHAGILLDDSTVVEAEPGGARIRPMTEYPADLMVWSTWDLTPGQRTSIVAAARGLEGTPYSFLDYFAIAAHRFRLPLPGLRRYVASSGHMICSQLVDEAYSRAGVHLFTDGRWPGFVTPADLAAVLSGPQR